MNFFKKLFKKWEVKNRKKKSFINANDLLPEQKRSEIQSSIIYCNIYEDEDLFEFSNIIIEFLSPYSKPTEFLEFDYFKDILDMIDGTINIHKYNMSEETKWIAVSFNPNSLLQILKYENKQPNQFISALSNIIKSIPAINSYIFGDEYIDINGIDLELTKVNKFNPIVHYDNINEFKINLYPDIPEEIHIKLLYLSTVLLLDNTVEKTISFLNSLMHGDYEDENFQNQCINQMKNDYSNFTVGDKHLIMDYQYFTKLTPTIPGYEENEKETFIDDIDEIVD